MSIKCGGSTPSFVCLGDVHLNHLQLHPHSYINNKEIQRLTSMDFDSDDYRNDSVRFFGHSFAPRSAWSSDVDALFFSARQKLNFIEEAVDNKFNDRTGDLLTEVKEAKDEILYFLTYIKFVIAKCAAANQKSLNGVVKNLREFTMCFGRINETPTYLFATASERCSNTTLVHLHFHLRFDLHWFFIEILFMVKRKNMVFLLEGVSFASGDGEEEESFADDAFGTYVHCVLNDLVQLAAKRHSKLQLFEYKIVSAFHCTCIRELWLLLRVLLDHDQATTGANSLWLTLSSIVRPYIHDTKISGDTNGTKDTNVGFVWWLLNHLVTLYKFDQRGNVVEKQPSIRRDNDYGLLQNLVIRTFETENCPKLEERVARCYLQCCYNVCRRRTSSCEFLSPLWNYFFKHFNSTFTHATSLDGFQSLCTSGKDLLRQAKERASNEEADPTENSFQMFLRLLGTQLGGRSIEGNQLLTQEWKQFKGRIFVKFHKRKMADLNDAGLNNFCHLFLTLACVGECQDVAAKAFDLIEMKVVSSSQELITWCGQFAFLHLCVERNVDLSFVARRMAASLSAAARCFRKKSDMSSTERHELLKLLTLYVKETQHIINDCNELRLSECILLGSGFKNFLDNCNSDEVQTTLTLFLSVMTKIRFLHRSGLETGGDDDDLLTTVGTAQFVPYSGLKEFWKLVHAYVKTACASSSAPASLPNVAGALTILIHDCPHISREDSAAALFSYFGLNTSVSFSFVSHYLCHILTQETIMKKLTDGNVDVSSKIIRSWVACSIFLPTSDQQMQELSRLIRKLPEVETLFNNFDANDDEVVDELMVVKFFKALIAQYNKINGFGDRAAFRQNRSVYFADLGKLIESNVNFETHFDVLKEIYVVVGCLVKFCSPLFYVRSRATGLLSSIVNRMLLPRCMYVHDKALPNTFAYAYRDSLDLYVDGLLLLNPSQDSCINNFLKEITVQCILKFPVKSKTTVAENHPIIKIFRNDLTGNEEFSSDSYLRYALRIIQENYLAKKPSNHQHQLLVVAFLVETFELCSEAAKMQIVKLTLLSVLNCVLDTDARLNKEAVLKCLKLMIQACRRNLDRDAKESSPCIPVLVQFAKNQIGKNAAGTFKIFEGVAKIHAPFVQQIVPALAQEIHLVEEQRGVGKDNYLRQGYRALMDTLM